MDEQKNESNDSQKEEAKQEPIVESQNGQNAKTSVMTIKVVNALAYLWILFFLPLLVCPNEPSGKFHANQGLILLLATIIGELVGSIAFAILPILGSIVCSVVGVASVIFVILGIVNVINGEEKELPWIGRYRLIK